MSLDEVLRIGKRLEKINSGEKPEDNAQEMLKILGGMEISVEILQKTRIGMIVNDLRKKTEKGELATAAKNLIKNWKKVLDAKTKNGKPDHQSSASLPRIDSASSNLSDMNSRDGSESGLTSSQGSGSGRTTDLRQTQFPQSNSMDDYRKKCREMLLNALKWTDMPDGTLDPELLAEKIELHLFEIYKTNNDKYKASVRSRIFNLRDKKNLELRENVLTGVVSPERFAKMTAEEMASKDMKSMRQKFTKEAIGEHQMSTEGGTATDMFKCGKCGKKNCTYTQVQTRSADEPMTTFVYCRECGNRWKFC